MRLVALSVGLTMSVAANAQDATGYNGFDLSNASVPLAEVQRGGPPKDGIPAIDHPKLVTAARSGLAGADRVLGLALDGIARAYPIRILNWHEVVNDRIGERPVVVTYCPLCGTGTAFEARVQGKATEFGVSGLLYNSDVLLYDRATESLWSQIMRTAVSGPMKGTQLQALPLTHTSWDDWRRRHPATQVLSTETGFARDYSRDPYAGYDQVPRLMFDVAHRDDRFAAKAWVLGIEVNGRFKAYPFSTLAAAVDERGELTDSVGGKPVRIRFDAVHRTAEAFAADGNALPGLMAFWFAWVAFHPGTETYRSP